MIQETSAPSMDERIQTLAQQYQLVLQRMQEAAKAHAEARDELLRIEGAIKLAQQLKEEIWEEPNAGE